MRTDQNQKKTGFELFLFHGNRLVYLKKCQDDPGKLTGSFTHDAVRSVFELNQPCAGNGSCQSL